MLGLIIWLACTTVVCVVALKRSRAHADRRKPMRARALLAGCRRSRRNTYRHICSTSRWRRDVKSSTLHTQREGKVLQTAALYHSGRPIRVKLTKSPSMSVGAREVRSGGGGACRIALPLFLCLAPRGQ